MGVVQTQGLSSTAYGCGHFAAVTATTFSLPIFSSWPFAFALSLRCRYLADNNVLFEGILLKPSMVTPGAEHAKKSTPEEVRETEVSAGSRACML